MTNSGGDPLYLYMGLSTATDPIIIDNGDTIQLDIETKSIQVAPDAVTVDYDIAGLG